ncbi:MAG: hypothetical protein QN172_07720 [Armatimonadota bacterium]|nr:hypothetical protein [Armatimonadota bacterium]MDR7438966.1 hypothetical protein [Armatimonadota bacterium]MDR7562864.1 hypothetical protein [Armatimonadota bacterium]MDR7602331.1 hypothetical protein [Armatimonadota bacterium]
MERIAGVMVVRQSGLTLLEVLVSLHLLAVAFLALLPLIRMGASALASGPDSVVPGPARLRTLAARYLEAELEYLRSWSYARLRSVDCGVSGPPPLAELRRIPGSYLPGEPLLPQEFAVAEIEIEDEPVLGPAPDGCGPRRIAVRLYRTAEDAANGRTFARAVLLRARR